MFRFSFLLLVAIGAMTLSSGCITTSMVYDPNVYHTGRTLKKGEYRPYVSAATPHRYLGDYDNGELKTISAGAALDLAAGVRAGLSDELEFGGDGHFGRYDIYDYYGLRLYGQYRLTEPGEQTAVSILPAVCFVTGDEAAKSMRGHAVLSIPSHLAALELHVPVSYHYNRLIALVAEPNLRYLVHHACFTGQFGDSEIRSNIKINDDFLCPGISFGVKAGPAFPEVNFLLIEGKLRPSGGLALVF